jgi:hypothetical protein
MFFFCHSTKNRQKCKIRLLTSLIFGVAQHNKVSNL